MDIGGLFHLQGMMFLLMGLGFFLRKRQIITPEGKKCLTDLIVDVILPCNIIHSFCVELEEGLLRSCLQILLVSVALQILCMLLAAFAYRRVPKEQRMSLQFGTVCSNASFLGNPVAEGLYGPLGLLYASIYVIPQRIVMWSVGVSYFTSSPNPRELVKKVATHPCIIAVAIGLVLMITGIRPPLFLDKSISSLGGCTTAITMLYIGAVLADAGAGHMVNRTTVFYAFLRLIAIPAAVLLGCKAFAIDPTAAGVAVVLAAMPAGSLTAVLAAKHKGDEVFACQVVVFTTLLSMALLPVWCLVLSAVL